MSAPVGPLTTPPSDEHDVFYEQLQDALEASTLPYYQAFDALQRAVSHVSGMEREPDASSSGLFGSYLIQRFKRAESSFFALAVSLQSILDSLYDFQAGLRDMVQSDDPHASLGRWLDRQYLRPDVYDDGSPETSWRALNPEELSPDEIEVVSKLTRERARVAEQLNELGYELSELESQEQESEVELRFREELEVDIRPENVRNDFRSEMSDSMDNLVETSATVVSLPIDIVSWLLIAVRYVLLGLAAAVPVFLGLKLLQRLYRR